MRGPNVWLPDLNSPDPCAQSRQEKSQNNNISVNTNKQPGLIVEDKPEFWRYDQSSCGHTDNHTHPAVITTTAYSGPNHDEEDQDDSYLNFDSGSTRASEEDSTSVNEGKEVSGIRGFDYDNRSDGGCPGVKVQHSFYISSEEPEHICV